MSTIQLEYANLAKTCCFHIKGHTLICGGKEYPVQMAKAIGIKPKMMSLEETIQLNKVWHQ